MGLDHALDEVVCEGEKARIAKKNSEIGERIDIRRGSDMARRPVEEIKEELGIEYLILGFDHGRDGVRVESSMEVRGEHE